MAAYATVSSKNRRVVGFAPFDMASPRVLLVTIQPLLSIEMPQQCLYTPVI